VKRQQEASPSGPERVPRLDSAPIWFTHLTHVMAVTYLFDHELKPFNSLTPTPEDR